MADITERKDSRSDSPIYSSGSERYDDIIFNIFRPCFDS